MEFFLITGEERMACGRKGIEEFGFSVFEKIEILY
jgi:hypothetical protein